MPTLLTLALDSTSLLPICNNIRRALLNRTSSITSDLSTSCSLLFCYMGHSTCVSIILLQACLAVVSCALREAPLVKSNTRYYMELRTEVRTASPIVMSDGQFGVRISHSDPIFAIRKSSGLRLPFPQAVRVSLAPAGRWNDSSHETRRAIR